MFDAAVDPDQAAVGVAAQRAGALERVRFALADLAHARAGVTVVEARMAGVLDELGLTGLVTSIPGLSAVGAATILAESGDPTRFSSARALVKHAGLCPRDNASGTYRGKTTISGRGRPRTALGGLASGIQRTAPQPRPRRPPPETPTPNPDGASPPCRREPIPQFTMGSPARLHTKPG